MSRSRVFVTSVRSLNKQLTKTTYRLRRLRSPATSILVVLTLLVSSTPAAPRLIVDQVKESRTTLAFWWARSDLAKLLDPQNWRSKKEQEKQEDRDARVARLQIFPGDVTVNISEQVSFSAIAFDADDAPVTGVKINFRGSDPNHGKPVRITSNGQFEAISPGAYRVVAEGAGQIAEVKVVVKPGMRRNLKEKPISVKPVSSRDEPDAARERDVAVKTEKSNRGQLSGNRRSRGLQAHASPAKTAPEPAAPAPFLPTGVGWDNSNYWYADDPDNRRGNAPGAPADSGAGEGNFQITAPILNLPGRGIDISLALTYNSRLWSKAGSQIGYNNDVDWPAPGWSLGFSRMVGMGTNGGTMLIEADGTRRSYAGTIINYSWGQYFEGHTTDGSFINYTSFTNVNGMVTSATADFPNGTRIVYYAYDLSAGTAYPTTITDRNGNYIILSYVNNNGPRIQTVTDTLGRVLTFHYDSIGLLTAITAPGLGGGTRTVVRLLYRQLSLSYGFSGLTTRTPTNFPWVLNAIYYPGTNTGYWFGDADSYSSYGMIAKVVEARGLNFSAGSLTVQGSLTAPSASQITRQEVYNYPLTPNFSLTDAPTYTTMTETWTRDGSNNDTATTQFLITKNATNPSQPTVPSRKVEITLPNGTKSIQYSHNAPGNFKDGMIYQDETRNSGGTLLQGSTTNWELGHYSSARPTRIEVTNERSQTTATEFGYFGLYNQVWEVRNYDYTGAQIRVTRTTFDNGSNYTGRHIFNLPISEEVFAGDGSTRVSRTTYEYDNQPLTSRPGGVAFHLPSYDPYNMEEICCDCCNWQWDHMTDSWVCTEWCPGIPVFDPGSNYRGNLTQMVVYSDAATPSGAIVENHRYDIAGNRVLTSTSIEQSTLEFTSATSYAYPISQTDGSPTDPLHQIKTSSTYDVNTGLLLTTTDANGRQSQVTFDPVTLRPLTNAKPTGAHVDYSYDDVNLTSTQTTYLQTHPTHTTIAEQSVTLLNGRGQVRQEKALGEGGVWDIVDTVYDSMGRTAQQSLPYRSGDTIRWNTFTYDALGRTTVSQMPDGSTVQSFFNELARPAGASSLAGETVRVVDAWGRERWSRSDALARLVEVVEPDPNGSGSVSTNGLLTTYGYNVMGDLTSVTQGSQTRTFKWDSLGRLKAQKNAEASATLNDAGTYVGSGSWSDVFNYDERSNVTSRIDARGVKTVYNYGTDPFSRLLSITFDTTGFGDTNNPVVAAPSITYQYRTKSSGAQLIDVTELSGITTTGVSTEAYTFDGEGRVQTSTLTLSSRPSHPFAKQYTYDALDRITDTLYPAEHGNGAAPRRTVHRNFDVASRLSSLTVDGQSHASNIVYNAASNTTSIKIGVSGTNQVTENYGYHAQTGLLENQTITRNGSTLLNLGYNYANANGKRSGQLVSITNNLDNNKNRAYEYDALGRLKRATSGNNVNWAQRYNYDRYGNRTEVFSYNAEQYIRNYYQNGLNRQPNATELSTWLSTLQTAYTQGQTQFLTAMQNLGNAIFSSQEYINRNRTNSEYVYDLYKTYLVREPDTDGWAFWTAIVATDGRNQVRNGFAWSAEFNQKVSGASPYTPPGNPAVPRDGLEVVKYDATNNRINLAGWNYDAAGNQTRVQLPGGTWRRFQYDTANRLVKIKADDNTTVLASFTYGCDNQRLIAEENNTRTYYVPDGEAVIAEYTENGAATTPLWSRSYVYLGGRLLSTLTPTGSGGALTTYHHPDRLSTRLISNAQNTSYTEQVTLPFGTLLPHETTDITNRRRFTNYDRSPVTGFDYALNRTYDSNQGRFTQVDPIGFGASELSDPQTLNLYAYCANDPINAIDPDGLFFKKLFKAIWKVLTNKWFIIAATVALTVISLGSSLGFWALKAANTSTLLGTPVTSAVLFGTHTTTLGWIAVGLSTALAIPTLGSWRAMVQRGISFGIGQVVGSLANLAGIAGNAGGPGGTPDWNPEQGSFGPPQRGGRPPRGGGGRRPPRGMVPWRPPVRRPAPYRPPPSGYSARFPRDYQDKNTVQKEAMFRSEGEARTEAFRVMFHMGSRPVEVAPGKWRSANGRWQFRAKTVDYTQNHVHLERLDPATGRVMENWHLRWPAGQSRPR
ncbi:MAG TPA: RHS repeat-associated core domain-containing protein [Pyrinomonadaceae bacterium]|nr:RHS repeat-associated core domain-containing protein [Pyrinomonadaceae bacterium]